LIENRGSLFLLFKFNKTLNPMNKPSRYFNIKNSIKEFSRNEISLLMVTFVMLSGIWLFIIISEAVVHGSTQSFDEWVLTSLRDMKNSGMPKGPLWLEQTMLDITALGGGTVIFLITTIVVLFLILKKEYQSMWFVLAAAIGGTLLSLGLKELFGRERPTVVIHLLKVTSLSFPSGHSMMSAVVYLTEASLLARIEPLRIIKIYIIAVALFLTFIIGFSRVYLGVHYPTDVIGGWAVGSAWACFCWMAARTIQKRKKS
jgi:undecaprenyl-diphosphatase